MFVLKMQNLSDGKEETTEDLDFINLVNDEIKAWIADRITPKSELSIDYSSIKELIVLIGITYTCDTDRKEVRYVAGMGTNLYHAIKHAQGGMDEEYRDDIILKMNVEYIPYKINAGFSVELTQLKP